jgi:hypothetical protein
VYAVGLHSAGRIEDTTLKESLCGTLTIVTPRWRSSHSIAIAPRSNMRMARIKPTLDLADLILDIRR